jgi:hypothetical protein
MRLGRKYQQQWAIDINNAKSPQISLEPREGL